MCISVSNNHVWCRKIEFYLKELYHGTKISYETMIFCCPAD
jgi:hypothetical protein